MTPLSSNFELDRYGMHVRLMREEDAELYMAHKYCLYDHHIIILYPFKKAKKEKVECVFL